MTLPTPPAGWTPWEPWGNNHRTTLRGARVAGMVIAHPKGFQCRVLERPAAVWVAAYQVEFRMFEEAIKAATAMMDDAAADIMVDELEGEMRDEG